jgi:hypothetical protein
MTPFEHYKIINRLKEIFGFKIPLDGLMMMALQRPVIDIIKLDEKLQREYKYKGSMNQFIKSKFGEEALRILEENIA